MKPLIYLVAFALLINLSLADEALLTIRKPPSTNPGMFQYRPLIFPLESFLFLWLSSTDYPGKCYLKEVETAIDPGKTFAKIGSCAIYRCNTDYTYEAVGCPLTGYPPNCKTTSIDHTKVYPDCCPQLISCGLLVDV